MGLQFLRLQWWYCSCLLFFFVVSCSSNLDLKKTEGENEFSQETSRLEKLAREDPSTPVRAKSHLKLAFFYVNSRNPQLNYSRALQEMESYLSMSPDKAQKDDFQNWLAVLREIDHLSKYRIEMEKNIQNLQAQSDKLQAALATLKEINNKLQAGLEKVDKANTYLRGEVATLKEINNKLIETIEKLKILDLQMEEKRNLIK